MLDRFPLKFIHWLSERKTQVCHRQLVVIQCSESEGLKTAEVIFDELKLRNCLIINAEISKYTCDEEKNFRSFLGQEFQGIVYNAHNDIKASALAALSGTICKQGVMLLLIPDLDNQQKHKITSLNNIKANELLSPQSSGHFRYWLYKHLFDAPAVCKLSNHSFKGINVKVPGILPNNSISEELNTKQQQRIIEEILEVFKRSNDVQILIKADRGRGKSSALGIICAHLLVTGSIKIAVSAPSQNMVTTLFKHFRNTASALNLAPRLEFIPIDVLVSTPQNYDVVVIDEAAAFPSYLLKDVVNKYKKVIFSSTVDGYEGSGRGFELRFLPYLVDNYVNFKQFTLDEPIRWFQNDCLESFWSEALLMNSSKLSKPIQIKSHYSLEKLNYKTISATDLVNSPDILLQIFTLLLEAHYQTTPDDLMRMLDDPLQSTHVLLSANDRVLSVALVNHEGGSNLATLAESIAMGTRRIKGHFVSQRLALYESDPTYVTLNYARIMRIATAPTMQNSGLGSRLLSDICNWGKDQNFDLISTSFGAHTTLVKFWHRNGFLPAKMGFKKDSASGLASLIMLKVLNNEYSKLLKDLEMRFFEEFNFQLGNRLSWLREEFISTVLKLRYLDSHSKTTKSESILSDIEIKKLGEFAEGYRPIYTCEWQLAKLLTEIKENKTVIIKSPSDVTDALEFLNALVINNFQINPLREQYQLTGKKQLEQRARTTCRSLLKHFELSQ